jgi:RHS repeat-associated protein
MITDEWFSYDKVGHMTDMWEKTPHSGTYYHSVATFAGNGVPLSVQLANPSLYSLTYGLDGEGRPSTLKEGTETIVAGTTFNASSQPTYIDLGTGTDQSDYVYDPKTGRMTNWTFQVGSGSETGALGWNANGTLKTLAINDGFNAGGSQNCNTNPSLATGTGYDDLGRLVGVDCGSGGWGQTFSYDQYDNLTKNVISGRTGITWNPGYSSSNNHYNIGSYDSRGNVASDTFHNYTWDDINKLKSVDSSGCGTNGECVTYDALGRAVETSYNSAYTEIWYTQLGKVYMTGGTTPYYAYWPTPGNGTVEVNGNAATNFYMHKDWLGNSRISSTLINHTVVSDQAYAPYGEVYDKLATGAGVPGQMFTGDAQDILTGIFDTPNRELNASQGRWLSPDPAGAGWNQYAYATNPLSSVDPTGLDNCDTPGDCDSTPSNPTSGGEPVNPNAHANGNDFGTLVPDTSAPLVYYGPRFPWCYQCPGELDPYTPGPEAFAWVARDYNAIVSGTNASLFWNGANGAAGGIGSPPASAANNTGSFDWGVFWNGVVHGVRQPGQSVTECMNQNVSNMTFGAVDPQKLFNQSLQQALAASAFLSTARGGSFNFGDGVSRPVSVGTQLLRWGTGALGLTGATRLAAVTAGVAVLRTGAVAGAAAVGTAIGSAINCR